MQWIIASERDLVMRSVVKRLNDTIRLFVFNNGDPDLAEECLNYWQQDKGIILHFKPDIRRMDLSFLRGAVLEDTLSVVCASKTNSLQRGYDIIGLTCGGNEKLVLVKKKEFVGFGSKNWKTISLGRFGYSIYIHLKGGISIRKFVVNELTLLQQMVIPKREDARLFKSRESLQRFLASFPVLRGEDTGQMARIIYNRYRALQRLSVDSGQGEEEPWRAGSQEEEGSGSK